MESIKNISCIRSDDAELAQAARDGDREAYEQIIARYQSLICSLAYCRTGSIAGSEDIAQETFVTAWKGLQDLREPGSLRVWLCGIARNLINNSCRRLTREPAAIGETLDSLHEIESPESSPQDQAIRIEEEGLLWLAMENLPENYREPLVLYYREERSVARVAEYLGLSEDAVKQRLARGRVLLQERVLALVEGTLERTRPGSVFTNGVLSVLPMLGTSTAAAMAASTAKASTTTKAVLSAGGVGFGATFLSLFASMAGYIGWQMSDTVKQSPEERRSVHHFWRWVVIGMTSSIVPLLLLMLRILVPGHRQPLLFAALPWWLGAICLSVGAPLTIWAWEHQLRVRLYRSVAGRREPLKKLVAVSIGLFLIGILSVMAFGFPSGHFSDVCVEIFFALAGLLLVICGWEQMRSMRSRNNSRIVPAPSASRGALRAWVALATVSMAALLACLITVMSGGGQTTEQITSQAALDIIATRRAATINVLEFKNGDKTLFLFVPKNENPASKPTRYFAPLDKSTLQALTASGATYTISRQGEDFGSSGVWPMGMLFLLALFVVVAGMVILVKTRAQPKPSAAG